MKKLKLKEVSEIYGGYAFKSKDFGVGENFVVKIKDIKPPIIDVENADKVDVSKYSTQKLEKFKVFPNDIVIAMTGATIGKVGRNKSGRTVFLNQRVAKINPNFKEDLDFIYYCVSNTVFLEYVLNNVDSKSAQANISHFGIGNFEINWYDRETRQKIAKVLLSLDDKIFINNQINQELEAMAKTLYDYWFVQFDFPDQNGKPYKSSGGKMVCNPELKREIPEGWGVEKLGDITICHDSKRVPLSSNDRELVKGKIPYYGATGIMDYVNDYIFDGDYVLMAEDGSVMTEKGTPILQRISGKNWVNNHAHVLEPVKNHSCKLLMMLLKDVSVMKIKTGSIQMKINQENMNKIVVPAIPLELLFEINQKLEVIDKQQLNLIEENKQLTQLRDWLLPMLMNGQVKV